jgi:hypothetical protein
MPQMIALVKDYLPAAIGQAPGLQAVVYGVVLIAFVLFEPLGLYGRWLKVRTYLQMFPFYRKGMFKRQKSFQKVGSPHDERRPSFSAKNLSVRFGGVLAVNNVSFDVRPRRGVHADRPQRRRQDHRVQPDQPHLHARPPARSPISARKASQAHRPAPAPRSPRWALRAPSRTSSCSSTPRCCTTC